MAEEREQRRESGFQSLTLLDAHLEAEHVRVFRVRFAAGRQYQGIALSGSPSVEATDDAHAVSSFDCHQDSIDGRSYRLHTVARTLELQRDGIPLGIADDVETATDKIYGVALGHRIT
jgi:hypothetical protein